MVNGKSYQKKLTPLRYDWYDWYDTLIVGLWCHSLLGWNASKIVKKILEIINRDQKIA